MSLRYRYTKSGSTIEGCIDDGTDIVDHHSAVRAVMQKIANTENEVITIDMISSANPQLAIGKDVFFPDSGDKETQTIQSVEISEDGKSWNSVSVYRQ